MGMRHFDVQLIGGMTLHEGKIAEMRTGEGKTLVATLGVYLNAHPARACTVTVNDYLARRDANWMRPLYEFLGLVGVVTPFQPPEEKRAAYAADITYGTNNEFGFDYLRDNMAFSMEEKFQRELNFAVIDEVDSILIDEARTPLIISGQAEDSSKLYIEINKLIPRWNSTSKKSKARSPRPATTPSTRRPVRSSSTKPVTSTSKNAHRPACWPKASLYSAHNLGLLTHVCRSARTSCSIATSNTSCRTARSSWSTNTPAVPCRAVVCPKACTRPSKPRKPEHPGRKPDPGIDHLPELLPSVHQAVRHDRYRRHRSVRIPPDLRSAGHGHSAEQAWRVRTTTTWCS
jgi:hypothetical protein